MEFWEKSRGEPPSHHMPQSPTLTAGTRGQVGGGDGGGAKAAAAAATAAANLMSESKINLSPDFKKKYEQWQKMKNPDNPGQAVGNGEILFTPMVISLSHALIITEFTFEHSAASAMSSPAMKEKKIRARPLGQSVVQTEQDLKPEFRLKVST